MTRQRTWKSIKIAIVIALAILLPYSCYQAFQNRAGPSKPVDGCPIKSLPAEATAIAYFLPGAFGPNVCYEFTISEKGFRDWVASQRSRRPDLSPIEERDSWCRRYNSETGKLEDIEVEKGLISSWSYTDIGVYLGYDRATRRAYFYYHSR